MLEPIYVPGQRVTVTPPVGERLKPVPLPAVIVMPKSLNLRLKGLTLGYLVKLRGEERETWVPESWLSPRREVTTQ